MASRPPLNYFMPDWIITDVICWIIARTKGDKTRFVLQVCLCVWDQRRDTCRCASRFVNGDRDHTDVTKISRWPFSLFWGGEGRGGDRKVIGARKNIPYVPLYFLLPEKPQLVQNIGWCENSQLPAAQLRKPQDKADLKCKKASVLNVMPR